MEKRVFKSNFLKGAVCAALVAFFCAALLTCSNAAGGSDAPSSQQSAAASGARPGYVTLTGTVSVSGAVPQILADTPDSSENENDLSRSARPGIDASGADATMEYFATATCGSDVVNGTFGSGSEAKKFGIELAASKTWSVVVGVRSKTPDAKGNKKIYLQSKPWSVTPDPADPTISRNFVPVPNTSGGEGKIELNVNYSASSNNLRVKFISGPDDVDLSKISAVFTNNTSNTGKIIKVENVKSGVYELCLDFLTTSGNMLEYSSLQTVTVADGMTTNAWVDDANASALSPISGGEFKFNNDNRTDLMAAFLGTTLFVGKVSSDSVEPDDSNSGNFLSPLKTITRAAERINAVGKSDLDYYIRVSGEVSGTPYSSAAVIQTLAAAKAKSLTIIGTSGPDADCIKSVTYQHSALNVTTPVPIKLKNIKIVGATGEGQGDAVSAWGSANVIIEDNVEITGADIGVSIGGSASVTMKGGTIAGNGVAVDMKAGSFVVQGGSIPYDSANKNNYVKTASEKFVTAKGDLAAVDASGGKIAIEPAQKKRGVKLVDASAATASAADIEAKFMVYDPTISAENPSGDEWQLVSAAADRALKINAPIYVGKKPDGTTDGSNDNAGTKSAPFATIEKACQEMNDAGIDYEINVRGTVSGQQTVPNALSKTTGSCKAKSVLIKGVTPIPTSGEQKDIPQDAINGGGSGGTALTVVSDVPITIQNLKITGGAGSQNGGGIYMNPGADVTILGGALITANKAKNHGGGIYCANGRLTIKGGKISANEITGSSDNRGGIGLYATGNSVIEMTGGEISGNKDTTHVDVVGGGVKLEGSASFKMSGGEVKDNQVVRAGGNFYVTGGGDSGPSVILSGSAKITGGLADSSSFSDQDAIGGAVWLEGAGSSLEMSGGEISGNTAKSSSGKNACAGIYVSGAIFTMTGGKISGNNVLGGNSQGGAVGVDGKFNISGSAYIPYGGAVGKNDVFLAQSTSGTPAVTTYAKINIANDITTTGTVATITPQKYKRGMPILSGTDTRLTSYKAKFPLSENDGDWTKNIASSQLTINADVYVAGTSPTTVSGVDYGKGLTVADGGLGTKSKPFKLISEAVGVFEDATPEAIVTVVGTASDVAQEIPSSFTTSQAVKLTLKGLSGSSVGTIKRYTTAPSSAASDGSALTINSTVPVTIQDLAITGGYKSGNGGGINLTAGTLKLGSGATITGNIASENGGGVYVGSSGTLFMYSSSLIGDSSTSTTIAADGTSPGSSTFANKAKLGGGIFNDGALYIGYSGMSGSDPVASAMTVTANSTSGYGIRRNLAESGAGIYQNSSTDVQVASGKISYNMATESGGAFYIAKKDSTTKTKVTFVQNSTAAMDSNKAAVSGGAVHIAGAFTIFSGNGHNNVAPQGGAIYLGEELNFGPYANFYDANNAKGVNDIYLEKSIWLSGKSNGGDVVASITMPDDKWIRGKGVLQSADASYTAASAGKFKATDSDFTVVQKTSTSIAAVLSADIYVAGTASTRKHCLSTATPTDSATTRGTASSPFASIKGAMYAVNADATTITVDGTLSAAQTIDGKKSDGASIPTAVTAITVKGYKANSTATSSGMLDGGSSSGKTMLTVNKSGLTVTVQDLAITGGNASSGGGIKLSAGTVNLESGAKVYSNKVTSGGSGAGVYVDASTTLNIKEGAEIYSNSANSGNIDGGGVYNKGSVNISGGKLYKNTANNGGAIYNAGVLAISNGTIGGSANDKNTAVLGGAIYNAASKSFTLSGGSLTYNYAASGTSEVEVKGGGIYNAGTLTISGSASISYNTASQTNTSKGYASGGGIYNASTGSVTVSDALTMYGNAATVSATTSGYSTSSGGAIYNAGILTMSKGTIGSSSNPNRVLGKTATVKQGGAIYQNGTFNISGSAVVYAGTGVAENQNDVYLASTTKYITVNDSLSGSDKVAAVTPSTWKRGNQVIAADGTKITSINATIAGRFAVSDSEWNVINYSNVGKLDAQLWVSGTGYASGVGAGSDSNRGTKSKPYASIKKAAEQCWTTDKNFTINISGMISGATQEIPAATTTTTLASKITLSGYTGNTTHGIDRGLASESAVSGGSALIINYCGYVDITNLLIMGGNTTGNGGGIQINGPSTYSNTTCPRVNLKDGVLVQQNKAVNGGGIYLVKSILCLSGSATIGNSGASDRSAADTAISNNINIATTAGGGIYTSGGQVHFGGAWINGTINKTDTYKLTGGVYANVCTLASGTADEKNQASGGIYCGNSTVYFYSGNINLNYGINTGGVYSTQSGFYMAGGTIHKNAGTGFYNDTNTMFYMYGDACIGERGATGIAKSDDCSNNKGGLINKGFAYLGYSATSTKEKLSGGIYRNYLITNAKNSGGAGIANTGSLYFDSGTIAYNYFNTYQSEGTGGGGIYSNNFVNMSGSSSTQYACITNNQSKEAGGGIFLDGTGAKLLMSGYALIGKVSSSVPSVTSGSVTIAKVPGINIASRGGGIAAYNGATICLGYSSFSSPTSNTTASLDNGGVYFNYAEYNGGGIYCQGTNSSHIRVYIASGKINANKADYSSSTTYGQGGGIWANMYADIYMGGGQISKNSAMNYGGGVYIAGALFMYGSALIGDTNTSTTTTTESNYSNYAKAGGGVYVTSTSGTLALGYDGRNGSDYFEKTLTGGIKHNFATGETTSSTDLTTTTGNSPTPVGIGGGVYMTGSYFYMKSGTIGYNKAYDGAGLAITHSVQYPTVYDGGSITYNSARRNGGGVAVHANSYVLIKGSVTYNTAASNGGAFYLTEGGNEEYGTGLHLEDTSGKISNNTATNGNGGGVCSAGGSFSVSGGATMAGNYAGGNGGAVYGTQLHLEGVASIPGTSGHIGQTKYNDIYSSGITAIWLTSSNLPAGTYFSDMYITLPSGLSSSDITNYRIVSYSYAAPDPGLASYSKFYLTQNSPYYSSKKIGGYGYLVNKN